MLAAGVAVVLALAALLGRIGSDAQWLAALGQDIAARGVVPHGVPFAATPTGHWPNALVLAELAFSGLQALGGDRALMLAQLVAVAGGYALLARDARRGGADGVGTAAALLLAGIGALPSLAIVRVQLFSLLLFPALLCLVRAQSRRPTRHIWLVVPLLALWSNLHGAALLGLGVVLAYLILERGRRQPLLSIAVAVACTAALGLTPALWRTGAYYHGVLTNVAAQRGVGMWGPLSLHSPLDVLLAVAAIGLIWRWRGSGARWWEWGVLAVLAVLTVTADRDGVWLLMFAVGPAARTLAPRRSLTMLTPAAAVAAALLLAVSVGRGPAASGASPGLVRAAVVLAHGSPVLADGTIDEQVALDGGRIWAGDPIDAFPRPVQAAYLDWLQGGPAGRRALAPDVHVVLVTVGSDTARLMASMRGFRPAERDATAILYERSPA